VSEKKFYELIFPCKLMFLRFVFPLSVQSPLPQSVVKRFVTLWLFRFHFVQMKIFVSLFNLSSQRDYLSPHANVTVNLSSRTLPHITSHNAFS